MTASEPLYKAYALVDPRDNKIRYIGITCQNPKTRLNQHICTSTSIHKNIKSNHKINWINNLKREGRVPIMKILHETTEDNIEKLEIELIKHYRTFCNLTNNAEGGFINKNKRVSEETKKKMSITRKGKPNLRTRHPLILTNIKTKEEIEFESVNKAAEFLNCNRMNFSMIINGKTPSVFGYTCRYKN